MKQDEIIEQIRDEMSKIEDFRVYYTMRLLGMRKITKKQVKFMKCCLALHYLGLPITVDLLRYVFNISRRYQVLDTLHTLGDKGAILLRLKTKGFFVWTIPDYFIKVYENPREI